jgi:hypothetical protein
MKLSEALMVRGQMAQAIQDLENDLRGSCHVVESELASHADRPAKMEELETKRKELRDHIFKIHSANTRSGLTELICQRDYLKARVAFEASIVAHLGMSSNSYRGRGEEKMVKTAELAPARECLTKCKAELHELEMKIQELNWTTEL